MVTHITTNQRLLIRKSLLFVLGLLAVGLGVNLMAESRLGGDGITVFYMGMKAAFNLPYGISSYLYNITIILLAAIFARKYLGLGSFIYSFGIGSFVYVFEILFSLFHFYPSHWISQTVFLVVGQAFIAFGLAVIITLKIGINALDCLILMGTERFGWTYRTQRSLIDASLTLVGFVLGGLVGIGTFFSVLTLGWFIQAFTGWTQSQLVNHITIQRASADSV